MSGSIFSNVTLEMLDVRGTQSGLAQELIEIFESVNRQVDTTNGDNPTKCRKAHAYFREVTKPLIDTVFRHTGVGLRVRPIQHYSGTYAISFNPTDDIKDAYGNMPDSRIKKQVDDVTEKMKKVKTGADNFGKVDPEICNLVAGEEPTLLFDTQVAFCSHLYHEQARRLSAHEIAAVVLHEIGHICSLVYTYSVLQTSLRDVTYLPKYIPQSEKELRESMDKMKDLVKAGKVGDREISDKLNKRLEDVEAVVADGPKFKLYKRPIYLLVGMLMMTCMVLTLSLTAGFAAFDGIWSALDDTKKWNADSKGVKTSDFKLTSERITDVEFRADDFVMTHGLSAYLMSALDKIQDNLMLVWPGGSPNYPAQSMLMYVVNYSTMLALSPAVAIRNSYGHDVSDRYKNTRRKILKTLSGTDVPKDYSKEMLRQLAIVDNILKKNRQSKKLLRTFNTLSMVMSSFNVVSFIANGNIVKRYEAMYQGAQDIEANEFHALKHKLSVAR